MAAVGDSSNEGVRGTAGYTWLAEDPENLGVEGQFELLGEQMQILNVGLAPGQEMMMEPGLMMYMGGGVGGDVTFSGCLKRCCGGEPCAAMVYKNGGSTPSYVGLTPAQPGEIISVDMAKYDKVSARKGAYLSSLGSAEPGCELDCNPLTCCFAGFGMVRQTVSGKSGHAFLSATGTVERKELAANETVIIDSKALVAWHRAKLGVRTAGTVIACCCNGEGCCNTTITGPGTAWIASMPFPQYKAQMGVTVQLDKQGNVKSVGGPSAAEMHRE